MILHKIEVGNVVTPEGVFIRKRQADAVDVAGVIYADEFSGRYLELATGWRESRRDALRAAADLLLDRATALLEQSEKLYREAYS
jgi:hypothetical protein